MSLDKELLDLLVCPESHAPVIQVGDWLYSRDPRTRRRYPIRDSLPIMLVEESQTVEVEEFERTLAAYLEKEEQEKHA